MAFTYPDRSAPEVRGASQLRLRAITREAETGISPHTGLASDFLNQFNEVAMIIEIACEDPDLLSELSGWRPHPYREHFEASRFKDLALILEAYALGPARTRAQFDALAADLGHYIQGELTRLDAAERKAEFAACARRLARTVRERIGELSALIHPVDRIARPADVEAMFAAHR